MNYVEYIHGHLDAAVFLDLAAKQEVAELGESEEEDEEHDRKAGEVLSAPAECRRQLRHRAIEADVLEDLSSSNSINTSCYC